MERILVFIDRYMAIKGWNILVIFMAVLSIPISRTGSGCSAFALALLVNKSCSENPDKWMCNVNIPMELIGGRYNSTKNQNKNILNKKEYIIRKME